MTTSRQSSEHERNTMETPQRRQARTQTIPPKERPVAARTLRGPAWDAQTSPERLPSVAGEISPADDLPATGSRIGQCEIIRSLGRGGMGAVFLARDLRLGRLVAIKLLAGHRDDMNERVLTEARATARCNHENIVTIHDVGKHAGRPYMVLEYVDGQPLSTWLSERMGPGTDDGPVRPLSPGLAVELMIPVVRALVCAHDLGIVHRDLKPANIMLASTGTIKVLDFGIATLLEDAETGDELRASLDAAPGAITGTLPYMSPEQLEGEGIDHRSDIWAVGIMLFEMVTGTHPIMSLGAGAPAGALPGALLDVTDLEIPMPTAGERQPDLGPLASVIDRCLIKDKARRTGSARVLLEELEALSAGRRALTLNEDDSPFAGLSAFQEADADRFYGRTRDIAGIATRLRNQPLLAIAGPAGAGKSSLVRAGVIPALERARTGWDASVVRPGHRPIEALADMLLGLPEASSEHAPVAGDTVPVLPPRSILAKRLRTAPGHLGEALRAWAISQRRRLLLFVDQLEELYTLEVPDDEIRAFLACLEGVADDTSSPLRVILSVRSEFLDRMAEHRTFMHEVGRNLFFLPPMDHEGLREALVRPVEAAGYRYEPQELVDDMVDAVAGEPDALRILQFTASKLWALRDRERQRLTGDSYQAMGGVAGTIAELRKLPDDAGELAQVAPAPDAVAPSEPRLPRRRRLVAGTFVALALLLVAAFVAQLWIWRAEDDARWQAQEELERSIRRLHGLLDKQPAIQTKEDQDVETGTP